jgi:hypothetical protein
MSLLRRTAGRVVGWSFEASGAPPPGLRPGRDVDPRVLDGRPVVLVLLLGADAAAVQRTAQHLSRGTAEGGPRALLLLDGPHFAAARRAGVAADHVLSRDEWAQRHPGLSWEDYLDGELTRLRRDFATAHVVALPPTGTTALDPAVLAEAMRPPARRGGRTRAAWDRAVARVERRIDRGSA